MQVVDVDVVGAEPGEAPARRLEIHLRDEPRWLGPSPMMPFSLVATTQRSRSLRIARPTTSSDLPPL